MNTGVPETISFCKLGTSHRVETASCAKEPHLRLTPRFNGRARIMGWVIKRATWYAVLAIALQISGCGGGEDGSSQSGAPPPPAPESKAPEDNAPLPNGAFGGGQGKILFAEGRIFPQSISEFDLATRQVRRLVDYGQDFILNRVAGGVSRAKDGTFAVIRNPTDQSSVILHYQADGTRLHEWTLPPQLIPNVPNINHLAERPRNAFHEGGALSPDAKSIALAESTVGGIRLEVVILDVQSGRPVIHDLLGESDLPQDKSNLRASTLWSLAGELYVISDVGLHRVDRATGTGTLMHSVPLDHPHAPMMSPDGRTIYFDQNRGNPRGGTIWSMDVASGVLTRRSIRSIYGAQYSPALSPDGEWLLLQEDQFGTVLTGSLPKVVSAVRLAEPPHDTQNMRIGIEDASGQVHYGLGRMVWY